jgi:hypothetical protein
MKVVGAGLGTRAFCGIVSQPFSHDLHLRLIEFMPGVLHNLAGHIHAEQFPGVLLKLGLPDFHVAAQALLVSHQKEKPAVARPAFVQVRQMKHAMVNHAEISEMGKDEFIVVRHQDGNGDGAVGKSHHRALLAVNVWNPFEQPKLMMTPPAGSLRSMDFLNSGTVATIQSRGPAMVSAL